MQNIEDDLKEMLGHVVGIEMALKLDDVQEIKRRTKVLRIQLKRLLTQRAADESESCVCKKPIVEKGFCFVCQSPVSSRR